MRKSNRAVALAHPKPSTLESLDAVADLVRDPRSLVKVSAGGRDRGPAVMRGPNRGKRQVHNVERIDIQYQDQRTRATVSRVVDTLGSLFKNGTISQSLYEVGLRFQNDFDTAHWETMPAMRLDGMPPGGKVSSDPHRPASVVDARTATDRATKALGGWTSACGISVSWILGMRWSLRQLAERETIKRVDTWTGALIGALGVLESHYEEIGYSPRRRE